MRLLFLFAFVFGLAGTPALAQERGFSLSGSARLRFEAIDGAARAGLDSSDTLTSSRVRVLGAYDSGAFQLVGEVWDSRVYGAGDETPVSTNEVNKLEIVQAYVAGEIGALGGAPVEAQLGRFIINLGSRRLIAADDYRNTTNGFTGLRLDAGAEGGLRGTLLYVLPQVRLPDDPDRLRDGVAVFDREGRDLVMYGAMVEQTVFAGASVQAMYLHLDERDRADLATRDRDLDTYTLRLFREPRAGRWDFDFEAMAQSGRVRESAAAGAAYQDVSAHLVHAELGYSWDGPHKARLSAEYEYVSGDEPGGDNERFDTLFGSRRSDLAPSGIYNVVGRANLSSPGLRFEIEPSARIDAFVAARALWLASDTDSFSTSGVRDASGQSGGFAGYQIEGRVRYWLAPERLRLDVNALYLDKGRFLRMAPNAPNDDDTVYVAVDLALLF